MAVTRLFLLFLLLVGLSGCTSAQERQDEADADIKEQKLLLLQDYRNCLKEHKGEENIEEVCEPFKEAAETFNK